MLFETKCPQSLSAPKQNNDLFGVRQIIKEKKNLLCSVAASEKLIIVGCWTMENKYISMVNKMNVQM